MSPLSGSAILSNPNNDSYQFEMRGTDSAIVDVFPGNYFLRLSAYAGSFSVPSTAYSVSLSFSQDNKSCTDTIANFTNGNKKKESIIRTYSVAFFFFFKVLDCFRMVIVFAEVSVLFGGTKYIGSK